MLTLYCFIVYGTALTNQPPNEPQRQASPYAIKSKVSYINLIYTVFYRI